MYTLGEFISADTTIDSYADLDSFFQDLEGRSPGTMDEMERWILDLSDTIRVWEEQSAWGYIRMSCDTGNEQFVARHELLSTVIAPDVSKAINRIQKAMVAHDLFDQLPERYGELQREFHRDLEMFRDANVALKAELSSLESDYDQIAGALVALIDGEELPLPRAAVKLQSPDRQVRRTAWEAIYTARYAVKDSLDDLYSKMVALRHRIARNADYENYRDFKHDELQRFDYTPDDCVAFHDAIEKQVVPLAREIAVRHREKLALAENDYRPWDPAGEPVGQEPLKPFAEASELLLKGIEVFADLEPQFARNLKDMDDNDLFDLDSRKGKAPGGYNYPLAVTGRPFIFMNAAGTQSNLETLMHEGGHAQHTYLTAEEPLRFYQHATTEMAETASMAMELLTSPFWNRFYEDEEELRRARREHLEGIITFLPWCAIVDAFQHWVYTHPDHTATQRDDHLASLLDRFGTGLIDWGEFDHFRRNSWQRQSHIFGVPFYYVEYGIAQLGALQIYRNFVQDRKKGLEAYSRGLALGSTVGLPKIWAAMDIEFDFSADRIEELMQFVKQQIAALDN